MINLGDVTFTLGTDDRALRNSMQTMQRFGSAVQAAQTITTNSANATAAAFRKQEAAATAALNRTLALTNQMRKVEGAGRFADQAAASFRQLNSVLTSGQLSALHYQRAMEQFRASTGNAVRGFKEYSLGAQGAAKATGIWGTAMRSVQGGLVLWSGPLGGMSARLGAFNSLLGDSTIKLALFAGGVVAAIAVAYQLGKALLDAGKIANALQGQFEAVTGSIGQSQQMMDKVVKISRLTGQSIETLAPAFAKFTIAADGTGATMAEVERQFTVVASAATKLQLSADQSEGIFRALEQMMSKGTVQAEELRGQLGDRLAGAVQIAARAMGVTTAELQKMMKAGELVTSGFLPKFIDELAKTLHIDGKPIDNYTAALNNMSTAWFQLRMEVEKQANVTGHVMEGYKQVTTTFDGLAHVVKMMPEVFALVGDWAGVASDRIQKSFAPQIKFFTDLLQTIRNLWTDMFGGIGKDSTITWAYVKATVYDAVNSILSIITNLGEAMPTMLMAVPNAVISMVIGAMNGMITIIEDAINGLSDAIAAKIPGMTTPIHIHVDPIEDPFKEYFDRQSTEIKRIMGQEHDILGDTAKAWEEYRKAVEEATKTRHGATDDFITRHAAGGEGITTPFELSKAGQQPDTSGLTEKETKALQRKLDAMKSINDEIARTNQEIDALGSTDDVMKSLNAQFKRDKEVEKYAKALRKAGADTAFITEKTKQLAEALKLRDDLMKEREAIVSLRDTMASSFDSIGHGLVDALTSGEDGLKSFLSVLKNAVNDIIDTWLQLAILNPIKNMLFGTDEPTLKGGFGDFAKAMPGLFGGNKQDNTAPFADTNGGMWGMLFGRDKGPNTTTSSNKLLAGLGSPLGAMNDNIQALTGSIGAWAGAIKTVETGSFAGNYNALGPITRTGDRAYGAYQMMGANVPSWSQKWLGQRMTGPEILGNQGAQDKIFAGQFGSSVQKSGLEGGVRQWFTGSPTGGGSDQLGTSANSYWSKFQTALSQNTDHLKVASQSVGDLANSSAAATNGIGQFGNALSQFPIAPSSGSGGIGSFFSGLFGGGGGGTNMSWLSPGAWGSIMGAGGGFTGLFRGGGMVGDSSRGGRYINPNVFLGAMSMASGGIVGDEVPIIAHRGERVVPKGAANNNNSGGVVVQIHNYAGAKVTQESSRDANGGTNIKIIVERMVAEAMSKPGTLVSNAMEKSWGIKPALNTR